MRRFVIAVLCMIALVPLVGPAQENSVPREVTTKSASNAELARRFYEEFHTGDVAQADEMIATNAIFHMGGDSLGREDSKRDVAAIKAAFPDVTWQVEDTLVDDDKVAVRWIFRGTHQAEYGGVPASGNLVEMSGITILLVENGQIVEGWIEFDAFGLLQQLGAFPPVAEPAANADAPQRCTRQPVTEGNEIFDPACPHPVE
ncbi:MAG TPA: ester cyclase [Thermomicrobiales bacterium]|nr:ester cyclase [Thermomicrobiales bacterium]